MKRFAEKMKMGTFTFMFKTWCYRSMDKTVWFLRKKEPLIKRRTFSTIAGI